TDDDANLPSICLSCNSGNANHFSPNRENRIERRVSDAAFDTGKTSRLQKARIIGNGSFSAFCADQHVEVLHLRPVWPSSVVADQFFSNKQRPSFWQRSVNLTQEL